MGPKSPETAVPQNVTILTKRITEGLGTVREITVRADNVGAQRWQEMLTATQEDGKERGLIVYRSLLSHNKFSTSKISVGTAVENRSAHVTPQFEDIGVKGLISPVVAKIHTHPRTPEIQHLKTTIPVDGDIQLFSNDGYSAMVVLDDGGAHLLIRTGESIMPEPPPGDLISRAINEVAAKGGVVADVQKRMNAILSPYGISYFYTETPAPAEDGTVTFGKP